MVDMPHGSVNAFHCLNMSGCFASLPLHNIWFKITCCLLFTILHTIHVAETKPSISVNGFNCLNMSGCFAMPLHNSQRSYYCIQTDQFAIKQINCLKMPAFFASLPLHNSHRSICVCICICSICMASLLLYHGIT